MTVHMYPDNKRDVLRHISAVNCNDQGFFMSTNYKEATKARLNYQIYKAYIITQLEQQFLLSFCMSSKIFSA